MTQRLIRHSRIYGLYVLLVLIMTYPLIGQFHRAFIGAPESDAYEYARHIWWYTYALQNGYPIFQHPFLAYPDGLTGWWLWAIPLQSFPAWLFALVLPLPVAFNLMTVIRLALNGWAMFVLVRHLTKHDTAAIIGGAIFMLYPTMQGQLWGAHVGILALWGVPLYVWALLRLQEERNMRLVLWAGFFFVVSLLGSTMILVFMLFPLTLFIVIWSIGQRNWGGLRRVTFAVLIGGLVALVFVAPAIHEQLQADSVRPAGVVRYSADLLAPITPSFMHPLWGQLDHTHTVLGTNLVEGSGYVGVIVLALTVIGLWRIPQARRWLGVALFAWVLSWGVLLKLNGQPFSFTVDNYHTFVPMPYALLQSLPVLNITRTPARFNLTVGFNMAILASYGVMWLWSRLPQSKQALRIGLAALLLTLIVADYQTAWRNGLPHMPTVTATIPDAIHDLANDNDIESVLNLPYDNLIVAKEAMYYQTAHEKPIVAGFVSRETPVNPSKLAVLQNTFDLALLDAAGVDVVIVFHVAAPDLLPPAIERLGTPRYQDERVAVFDVPNPDNEADALVHVMPPTPIEQALTIDTHATAPTWATLQADITTLERDAIIQVDGETMQALGTLSTGTLTAPVFLPAGYHRLTLAATPTCPPLPYPSGAMCAPFTVERATLGDTVTPLPLPHVTFGDSIHLVSAAIAPSSEPDTLTVWLRWAFDAPLPDNAIRFVQAVESMTNQQLAGDDTPLGQQVTTLQHTESVTLTLPEGTSEQSMYEVYVGWYTYPDLQRLPVSDNIGGAQNGWAALATMVSAGG